MHELKARGAQSYLEALRIELYDKINALGIGAQGLGGLNTVLDVKIVDYPTHAASKPIVIIPNCAATRHIHFELDGNGAQGLGVLNTVLDVKIVDYPTHAASKPIVIIPNCAATRHIHFELDGNGVAQFTPP